MAEENAPEGKKKGKLKTLIVMACAVILAIVLSVFATLFFLGGDAEEGAVAERGTETGDTHQDNASYYSFDDPFIVTLTDERQRYLQVHLAVVMRDQDIRDQLKRHHPTLRSRIQTLLASQSFRELRQESAREALRESLTGAINQVLREEASGDPEDEGFPRIEQVLYTNFVMQ